jgi:NADH-quinone oxidoreductase subunit K
MTEYKIYLIVFFEVFFIALFSLIFFKNNFLFGLILAELTVLAGSGFLLTSAALFGDSSYVAKLILLLSIAAAESAVGLALIVRYYKLRNLSTITSRKP